jgi:hypothetical protein
MEITKMAQLSSPGISVTVVDESFYTPAAPGTVPLIIVATQANKANASGTGTAPGTLAANAGKVYLLTSQMDLGNTFGIPFFQTDAENNPVHAGEVNEYGLLAAHSFLGVSNQAYVVRADIDLGQLDSTTAVPTGTPVDGKFWWSTGSTNFGIFQWNAAVATATNGQSFIEQSNLGKVKVITSSTYLSGTTPLSGYGSIGDYAVVATTTLASLWFKKGSTVSDGTGGSSVGVNNSGWVQVGATGWVSAWPTIQATIASPTLINGDTIIINGQTVSTSSTTVGSLAAAINTAAISGISASIQNGYLNIYSTGIAITLGGTTVTKLGLSSAGAYNAPALSISPHFTVPAYANANPTSTPYGGYPTGSIWIKTTTVNQGANWDIEKYNATTGSWIRQTISQLYANNQSAMAVLDKTGGGINIPVGQCYVKFNDDERSPSYANFKIYQRTATGSVSTISSAVTASTFTVGVNTFTVTSSQAGSASLPTALTVTFTATAATSDANLLSAAFNSAVSSLGNVSSSVNSSNQVVITHSTGGDIRVTDGTNTPLAKIFNVTSSNYFDPAPDSNGSDGKYIITAWSAVNSAGSALVTPAASAPSTTPAEGTLWYNGSISDVDIMVNNGSKWCGFQTVPGKAVNQAVGGGVTDPLGPIISATQPATQQDGATALANGDIWVDSSNLENWPTLYKYNYLTKKWVSVNVTDQTTQNGIIFADARWADESANTGSKTGAPDPATIVSLLSTDFVDFDCPDPALYPKGTLLYNLRRSSFNVKQYDTNYVSTTAYNTRMSNALMTSYYPDRWVSVAPNNYLGTGQFGRKAQRAVILKSLTALIEGNQEIRDEDSRTFNLISCPGYLETLPSLDSLNTDRGLLSFVVADSPARLTPDATTLNNWGKNTSGATGDGEIGLISTNAYSAVYYPWGYTTDLSGNNVAVPPSHIMLRTIALSDNVAYPWFAPAGVRRGGVTNAMSVGYIDGQTGEFNPVALNVGQRDTLADIHVNPITYIGGVGLVAYGQKTRQLVASSIDRINVARLVIYLRYQLNAIAKPFIFEPNDQITRNEIKQQIEKLLLNLTAQRALYDYIVVCDSTNNTPSRIDASELYVDIAIEPVKAVEFIYIPLRLENTGAIKGLSGA